LTEPTLLEISGNGVNPACERGDAGAVDLCFETMAFWIVIADHEARRTFAGDKRHKLREFADGRLHGNEQTHEKSI
jgi:hypothetical protein